jgi:hypothetical protein
MIAIDDGYIRLQGSHRGTHAQNINQKTITEWNETLNSFRPPATSVPKLNVFTINEGGGRPDPTTGPNAPVPQPTAGAPDKDVLPIPVDFTSSWTGLTNGTSSDQNTLIQQLGQPLNTDVTIWQYWHHYNLDQFDWTQPPPDSFPPELQAAIKFVQSSRVEEVPGRARLSRRDRRSLLLGALTPDPRGTRGAHH